MRIRNIKSVKTHFKTPIGQYNLLFEKLSQENIIMVSENHLTLKIFRPIKFSATKIFILSSKIFRPKTSFWPQKFVDWNIIDSKNFGPQKRCTLDFFNIKCFIISNLFNLYFLWQKGFAPILSVMATFLGGFIILFL